MIAYVVLLGSTVFGCTCFEPTDVEWALDLSKYAAIFKVVSVERLPAAENGKDRGIRSARLRIEKVFKGNLKVGQELNFKQGSGGGDCLFTFSQESIGLELLLYLAQGARENGLWEAWICTRSNGVKFAAADIRYLEDRSKQKGRTRLAGQLRQEVSSGVIEVFPRLNVLSGRTVEITGNRRTYKLKTDADGVYEIYDLPAGKYMVRPESVIGYQFSDTESGFVEVDVAKGEHTNQDFEFEIDNRIRFKAIGENGLPQKGCFELEPTFGTRSKYMESWAYDCADADGLVEFQDVPEGTYLIFNDDDKDRLIFYPGVTDKTKAVPVRIGPGEFIDNIIFTMPVREGGR